MADPAAQSEEDLGSDRKVLFWGYLLAVLMPLVAWGIAIYVAVSERRARIRRHAIGIAAAALTAAGIYTVVILTVSKSHRDQNVATDLKTLLDGHAISYSDVTCAHESADQYSCVVAMNDGPRAVQVTDDGKSIVEQGINAP